jgi:hypothetical protein
MTISLAVWMASISFTPPRPAIVDEVDLAVINHVFDEEGRVALDQIIYYDWSSREGRFQVRDWRLLKHPAQIPLRNWRSNNYVAVWQDPNQKDVLRRVHAKILCETWTAFDPELLERDYLPQEKRRCLQKVQHRGE